MILSALLILALSKWAIYRLSVMAILLYCAESGIDLPEHETIQKYRMKVVMKRFNIKGDENNF